MKKMIISANDLKPFVGQVGTALGSAADFVVENKGIGVGLTVLAMLLCEADKIVRSGGKVSFSVGGPNGVNFSAGGPNDEIV